ncbi:MAG: response regulator transcription factor [Deltaproteobacteria bacterium]|nr:response regulator transcription factor [Deltaproteobacteria bacterium]
MDTVSINGLAMVLLRESSHPLVLLASPRADLRQRWKAELCTESYSVDAVAERPALERYIPQLSPSLLLLDLGLSKREGVNEVFRVKQLSPQTKIIVFSPAASDAEGIAALRAGARGYCQDDLDGALLRRAIEVVRRGEVWTSRSLTTSLLNEFQFVSRRLQTMLVDSGPRSLETLTYREYQVGSLISCGASNREIAQKLQVAERTVKAHVTSIFRKLGISDRVRLALLMTGKSVASPSL